MCVYVENHGFHLQICEGVSINVPFQFLFFWGIQTWGKNETTHLVVSRPETQRDLEVQSQGLSLTD